MEAHQLLQEITLKNLRNFGLDNARSGCRHERNVIFTPSSGIGSARTIFSAAGVQVVELDSTY